MDAGEDGEDRFTARRDGAENSRGGVGMRFKDNNRDKSASASNSNDEEATVKDGWGQGGARWEHEANNTNEEAEEIWRALATSLFAAVGGEGDGGK